MLVQSIKPITRPINIHGRYRFNLCYGVNKSLQGYINMSNSVRCKLIMPSRIFLVNSFLICEKIYFWNISFKHLFVTSHTYKMVVILKQTEIRIYQIQLKSYHKLFLLCECFLFLLDLLFCLIFKNNKLNQTFYILIPKQRVDKYRSNPNSGRFEHNLYKLDNNPRLETLKRSLESYNEIHEQ